MGSKREGNVPSGLRFADGASTLPTNGAIGYDEQVSLRVGILQEVGEDDPNEEQLFRDFWKDETQRDVVLKSLKADREVRARRAASGVVLYNDREQYT